MIARGHLCRLRCSTLFCQTRTNAEVNGGEPPPPAMGTCFSRPPKCPLLSRRVKGNLTNGPSPFVPFHRGGSVALVSISRACLVPLCDPLKDPQLHHFGTLLCTDKDPALTYGFSGVRALLRALSITFSSYADDRDSHKTRFSSILSYIETTKRPTLILFFFSVRSSCPQTHDIQYAEQSFRRAGAEGSRPLPDSHLPRPSGRPEGASPSAPARLSCPMTVCPAPAGGLFRSLGVQ